MSGDLSCVWTEHLLVTKWQVDEMKKNADNWRPLAIQIKDHNDNRKARCEDKK